MLVRELLELRLEYCLIKQKAKKFRSPFYNFKVKQYDYLINVYKEGCFEDRLQTAEMLEAYLPELYEDALNNSQYEIEVLGKSPEDIEELYKLESEMRRNKAKLKALTYLIRLEDFYEASQWDVIIARRWDWFCQFGRI